MTQTETETVEVEAAEVVETAPPPPRPAALAEVPATAGMLIAGTPAEQLEGAQQIAETLAGFIRAQGLARRLSKRTDAREFVQVEGWQFLGSMLGLTVKIEWTRRTPDYQAPTFTKEERRNRKTGETYTIRVVDSEGVGGWEARARVIRIADDYEISTAEMECLWSEGNWSDRDSYALRSMAETRATSKALRLPLAFVMVLAGFAATPLEEVDGVIDDDPEDDLGPKCPACGSSLWDNRDENEKRIAKGQKRMPPWKCKNRGCTGNDGEQWISWRDDEFVSFTNYVKAYIVAKLGGEVNVSKVTPEDRREAWTARYVDAVVDDATEELIAEVLSNPTPIGMGGIVWRELLTILGRTGEEHVSAEDRDRLTTWVDVLLDHPTDQDPESLSATVDERLAEIAHENERDLAEASGSPYV